MAQMKDKREMYETKHCEMVQRDTLSKMSKRSIAAYRQYRFNHSYISDFNRRNRHMKGLIHALGLFQIAQPFYCRYGSHIFVGRDFSCGHNAVFEDEGRIHIGDHVQMGNHVTVTTVKMIKDPYIRRKHKENVADVYIGNHVYIGHNVTIMAGVEIGDCATIQDGSVVVEDVCSGSVVAGNPAMRCEQESELLASFMKSESWQKKASMWERCAEHINLDRVDRILRLLALAGGVYTSVNLYQAKMKHDQGEDKQFDKKWLRIGKKVMRKGGH